MISEVEISRFLRAALPDAEVTAIDTTGTRDHWRVEVVSGAFAGRSLLDRHRLIQKALAEPMGDGRIHALEIAANAPDGQ